MSLDSILSAAVSAFERREWSAAFAHYTEAAAAHPLEPEHLERLAATAYLLGDDRASSEAWTRAHQLHLERGDVRRAAFCAFWLGFSANALSDTVRGGGWIARGRRLLDEHNLDCAERGYLQISEGIRIARDGDAETAYAIFREITALGRRFGDPTLTTIGRLGEGRNLILLGRIAEGVPLLDEVLVSMSLGEVSPMLVGMLYCSALDACHEIFDLRRAQEWTNALTRWCEAQPALMPYRGQCLVKRAELMQLHGAWDDAMLEVRRACDRLSHPPGQRAVGLAFYQQGELHRLRGELAEAEAAYRRATQAGWRPQPGLALLRLAQGHIDAAVASIRGELAEAKENLHRIAFLPAVVEITVAAGDLDTARACADELAHTAEVLGTPLLRATAAQAMGTVLLAEGDARAALTALREAWSGWQELEAPYAAARARLLVGTAARALGDEDSAAMELDAARCVFQQLGAAHDLAQAEALLRRGTAADDSDLSARELQVLRLIAEGRTNRQIAQRLMISEKTVARHVSNIFLKLDVSTRAAATAYAYEHELV
jgi:DNA-binding NarL/FixJ family response regulator